MNFMEIFSSSYFIVYLIILNVVTFLVYGLDKWKAKQRKWRIREASLLLLAVLGGSIGAWLGMKVWHHKTQHKKFKYGVPLILLVQIVLLFLCSCSSKQPLVRASEIQPSAVAEHSPSVLLVMYDQEIGKEPLLDAIKKYKATIKYDYHLISGMAIQKPDDKTLEETMAFFKKVEGVKTVEYDYVHRLTDPVRPRLETR